MTVTARATAVPRLVRLRWWHPEWWIYLAAAAAWIPLVLLPANAGAATEHSHHAQVAGATIGPDVGREFALAGLMAVAMMAPLMAPTARFVALAGLWSRRVRGPTLFMASYLAAWALVALLLAVASIALVATVGPTLGIVFVTTVVLAWQLSRPKRRALRRGVRIMPLAARGGRADRDCLRFGLDAARSCIVTCWGLMALAAASHHSAPVVGILFVLQVRERSNVQYEPRLGALVIAALGAAMVVLTIAPLS